MGAVQRAVFRLNEPEKLDAFLRELGRKHVAYGANVEYIDVSTAFISFTYILCHNKPVITSYNSLLHFPATANKNPISNLLFVLGRTSLLVAAYSNSVV